jgi:hypothetical protein
LIRARTGEGRERAKARGVRFGRPKKLTAHQRREAIDRIDAGEAVAGHVRRFGRAVGAAAWPQSPDPAADWGASGSGQLPTVLQLCAIP